MKNTIPKYDYPSVGCYVDESSGSADDCNARTIDFAKSYGFAVDESEYENADEADKSQVLSELADDAVSYLNELEDRPFMYWGHEDNSLYLMANVDGAREDCAFVTGLDGKDYPAADYEGEWLHVSDHGNATLYVRTNGKDKEIWGVV